MAISVSEVMDEKRKKKRKDASRMEGGVGWCKLNDGREEDEVESTVPSAFHNLSIIPLCCLGNQSRCS